MTKIIKGKKYVVFGNFPDAEGVSERLSEKLEIDCLAFLSNTDSVSFVEYEEEDSEVKQLKKDLFNANNYIKEQQTIIDNNEVMFKSLRKQLKSKWF